LRKCPLHPGATGRAQLGNASTQRLDRSALRVAGGLGKRFDLRALIKAAGLTPSMVRRAQLFASLTEQMKRRTEAEDKAFDREARYVIRARK
jgi:hypothetical protein